jgi:threonine/homoserine/homoserine lactone efflux protein
VTVVGVNFGNSTLALASAVGMAALFARWPWSLEVVKVGGAAYLAYLGVRGLWMAWRERPIPAGGPVATAAALSAAPAWTAGATGEALRRGIVTNLLNPSVVVFYMTLLPQFIGPHDPFLPRFLVLAATHVTMSLTWLTTYAVLMGTFAERMSRPGVRRALESLTGLVLLGFGVRLIVR